jgi:hypothetical protein
MNRGALRLQALGINSGLTPWPGSGSLEMLFSGTFRVRPRMI